MLRLGGKRKGAGQSLSSNASKRIASGWTVSGEEPMKKSTWLIRNKNLVGPNITCNTGRCGT
jgi:hypothetical protein